MGLNDYKVNVDKHLRPFCLSVHMLCLFFQAFCPPCPTVLLQGVNTIPVFGWSGCLPRTVTPTLTPVLTMFTTGRLIARISLAIGQWRWDTVWMGAGVGGWGGGWVLCMCFNWFDLPWFCEESDHVRALRAKSLLPTCGHGALVFWDGFDWTAQALFLSLKFLDHSNFFPLWEYFEPEANYICFLFFISFCFVHGIMMNEKWIVFIQDTFWKKLVL